jgi:hypothetical protein
METDIINLISNVGFPIGAWLLMWYSHNSTLKKLIEAIDELKNLINIKQNFS